MAEIKMLKFGDKEVFIFAIIYPGTVVSVRGSQMELHSDGLRRKLRWLTLASHLMTFQVISKSQIFNLRIKSLRVLMEQLHGPVVSWSLVVIKLFKSLFLVFCLPHTGRIG